MLHQSTALSSQIKHHCQSSRMTIPTHFLFYYGSCPTLQELPLYQIRSKLLLGGISPAFFLQLYILLLSPSKLMLQKRWVTPSFQNIPCVVVTLCNAPLLLTTFLSLVFVQSYPEMGVATHCNSLDHYIPLNFKFPSIHVLNIHSTRIGCPTLGLGLETLGAPGLKQLTGGTVPALKQLQF